MDKKEVFIGDNSPEDVKWLCSLSESELDMLISLKKLALQRAKVVGHENLAERFNLRILRALGCIVMKYVKGQVKELGSTESNGASDLLEKCNLMKLNMGLQHVEEEDISTYLEMDKKRRPKPSEKQVLTELNMHLLRNICNLRR